MTPAEDDQITRVLTGAPRIWRDSLRAHAEADCP